MWWEKPHNLDRLVLLSDAISEKSGTLLVFRNELQELYRQDQARYEVNQEQHWRILVLDALTTSSITIRHQFLRNVHQSTEQLKCFSPVISFKTPASSKSVYVSSPLMRRPQSKLFLYEKPEMQSLISSTAMIGSAYGRVLKILWFTWYGAPGPAGLSPEKLLHILFNLLYGVGHIGAWNSHFPTLAERWIWRASAIMLTAVPLWATLWILWWRTVGSRRKWFWIFRNGDLEIVAGPLFCAIIVG